MNLGKLALSLPVPGDVTACLEWARRAEDLGYESIWIAETGGPDPFVLAGAVAQVTKRVRIGLAVSPVYIRTPATIAAAAGDGVAAGAGALHPRPRRLQPRHRRRAGTARRSASRSTRVRETVTTVRGMLAGKKVELRRRDAAHARLPPDGAAGRHRCRSTSARCGRRCSSSPARSATASRSTCCPPRRVPPTRAAPRRRRAPRRQGSGDARGRLPPAGAGHRRQGRRARSLPHRADRLLRHAGLQPVRRLVRLRGRGAA